MQSKKITLFITMLFCIFLTAHIHSAEEVKEIETLKHAIANSAKMSALYATVYRAVIKQHTQAEPEKHVGDPRGVWCHYTDQLKLLSQASKILAIHEAIAINNSDSDDTVSTYHIEDYTNALNHHKASLQDQLSSTSTNNILILNLRRYLQPMLDTVNIVAANIAAQAPSWRTILPTKKPSQKDLGLLKNPFWGLAFAAAAGLYSGQTRAMQRTGVACSGILAIYNTHSYYKQLSKHNLIKNFKEAHTKIQ